MLLLFETPAGYSLFKVKGEKKLQDAEVRASRVPPPFASIAREKARAIDAKGGGTRDARAGGGRRRGTREARGA